MTLAILPELKISLIPSLIFYSSLFNFRLEVDQLNAYNGK